MTQMTLEVTQSFFSRITQRASELNSLLYIRLDPQCTLSTTTPVNRPYITLKS